MEEKVDQFLSYNLVRENYVSCSTFLFLRFILDSIFYHSEHLDRTIHTPNGLRGYPILIDAARTGEFRKYAVVSFPWTKTAFPPFFTWIPPHVIMMAEIEILKRTVVKANMRYS